MFNLTRGEELTALILVALGGLAVAAVCLVRGDKPKTVEIPLNKPGEVSVQGEGTGSQGKILVHVSGEVHRKGVLELDVGSRVADAVQLARPTENADLEALNLAAPLVDGERLVVPGKGATPITKRPSPWARGSLKININTASQKQLEMISGIGPVLAGRIIEYRNKQKFESVDELVRIKGIGPVTLEKIRGHVRVK
jgi:competence protein ComEA